MISESETVVSKPRKWADLPDEYKETIEAVIRKLRINKLTLRKKSHMLKNTFDPTTFPSFRFKEIPNQETKADAAKTALYFASKRWDYIERQARTGGKIER